MIKVAFQGERGAYSEAAVSQYWRTGAEPVPLPQLEDVFDRVEDGKIDAGLVPVENTIEGSIFRTYDLLKEHRLTIQGETVLRVVHCLIALPGVGLGDVRRVYSHPQALGQAREYLAAHCYEPVNYYDTAGAVKMIKENGLKDAAAVASRHASEIYGMSILAEGIETTKENYTRFLHLGHGSPLPTGHDKTTVSFTVHDKPRSLVEALCLVTGSGLNLTKIESRPLIGKPWEYVFFVDFEGHRDDPDASQALKELSTHVRNLRILGSYPRA